VTLLLCLSKAESSPLLSISSYLYLYLRHVFFVLAFDRFDDRVQRSEVRAERLVFLAKDNRRNLLRTCVIRVT